MIAWTPALIKYWIDNYESLRKYELNPFEEYKIFMNEYIVHGSRPHMAPYEDTCDLNWEFDQALKKLGSKEVEFRRLYIDREGENLTLFQEFVKLLKEVSDET